MLITQKSLSTLEFDKIKEMLASCASSNGAKSLARTLFPDDDFENVMKKQSRTFDARRLIDIKGYPSFSAPESVVDSVERVDKGSSLSVRELLDIASLLRCARMIIDYISVNKNFDTSLDDIFSRLFPVKKLEDKINRAIVSEDMIADEASPELAEIRRKIKAANNKIKDTLQEFISGQRSKYLQENLITMRDGRYVVPVKNEYRNEIKGLLHDTSSSGATVFIEPMGVVEANNELRELSGREEREISRILAELSGECAEFSSSIKTDYYSIVSLDFYYACATLAMQMKAARPNIFDRSVVNLKRARHPLLNPEKVVPINISLGNEFDTLIITGPNTGGKTVALKTLALFSVMVQSGLQIPSDEESEIGIFKEILLDIGDEQSIEQSLSTFSSHMVNIIEIISKISERSLVLFDELGSGTDPVEGAALAISVLEHVRKKGALTAATTHYAELKAYALDTQRVQNASCEFDINTLKPTYRLIVGMPGKSNAFAISEKLGLPSLIVEDAKNRISGENRRFEHIVEQLEKSRIEMDRNKEEAARLRSELEKAKEKTEEEIRKKREETEKELKKTKEKSRQLIEGARATSEFVFRELDSIRKKQESKKFAEELLRAKQEMRDKLKQSSELYYKLETPKIEEDENYVLPRPLKVGDLIYLLDYQQEGEVLENPDKNGNFKAKAGILKTKVNTKRVRLLEKHLPQIAVKTTNSSTKKPSISNFKQEIDLRGRTGEEAWYELDKYLDDALMAGLHSVRIIHGKGTGALRKYIQEELRCDRRVLSYRNGEFGEGDFGVTIAELK